MHIDFKLSPQSFDREYREQHFLLLRGALSGYEFSLRDVNQLLHATEPTNPMMRLHNGAYIPEERYVEIFNDLGVHRRRINRPRFYKYLREGATLILNRVDVRHPLIRTLCHEVSCFVAQNAVANGYLAFGHNASFGKHWDCHDVFAVQLHGRKRWQLFKPTMALPLPNQTSKDVKHECPETPELDIVLETGDVLYIPRGWWHCATPIGEETFHVAIGVHPPFVTEYISWLCHAKLPALLSCRQSLSLKQDNTEKLAAAVEDLARAAGNMDFLNEYLDVIRQSDRVQSVFDLEGGVKSRWPALGDDQVVRANIIYPRLDNDASALVVNGERVQLSGLPATLMRVLATRHTATIRTLIDESGEAAETVQDAVASLLAQDLVQVSRRTD